METRIQEKGKETDEKMAGRSHNRSESQRHYRIGHYSYGKKIVVLNYKASGEKRQYVGYLIIRNIVLISVT